MLQRRGNQWALYPFKVRYKQHGKEFEQWALPNKEWWIDFADKWVHTEIIEFVEVELTDEQRMRFEKIRDMPNDFPDMYTDYILSDFVPLDINQTHPMTVIRLVAENERLKQENVLLRAQNQVNADRTDFREELVVELAMDVYS